ncbi:class C sortase [Microbacterium sp. ZW T5_56]|uniref:class C sortase n=1 Tax=Microbacterium sp. ZW T5_56 TaxID=3378081 RepID=UPI0038542A14
MATRRQQRRQQVSRQRTSRFLVIMAGVLAWAGLSLVMYPTAAAWVSMYNQSLAVESYEQQVVDASPAPDDQIALAEEYNSKLSSGAILAANANVPTGSGSLADDELNYWKLLDAGNGVMGRVQIPAISVDLPIYHGTTDEALLAGAGHLQGTSLPVGGEDTHSVLTAHRGLANARMFTDLDKVKEGDTFSVTTFGHTVTYQVIETKVVEPEDTASLRQEAGKDLVTLVTCTPLGINTHRILVTGTRVTPTPPEDEIRGEGPVVVPFPWWFVVYAGVTLAGIILIWWFLRRGNKDRTPRQRRSPEGTPDDATS